jgi:hypothetical protein
VISTSPKQQKSGLRFLPGTIDTKQRRYAFLFFDLVLLAYRRIRAPNCFLRPSADDGVGLVRPTL